MHSRGSCSRRKRHKLIATMREVVEGVVGVVVDVGTQRHRAAAREVSVLMVAEEVVVEMLHMTLIETARRRIHVHFNSD